MRFSQQYLLQIPLYILIKKNKKKPLKKGGFFLKKFPSGNFSSYLDTIRNNVIFKNWLKPLI